MGLGSIDTVEQVAIQIIIKLASKRLAEVLGTSTQDLIRPEWRPLRLALYHRLALSILRWKCEVWMSVEIVLLKLDGLDVHGLDLLEIGLVVQAIAEHIAKCAKCALQTVGSCLFLRLLE